MRRRHSRAPAAVGFARFRFPPEVITLAVRWHLRCHGEEKGLFGSSQHVAAINTTERDRIHAVINMDMIATKNTTNRSVLLEGAPLPQPLIDELATAAGTCTTLTVQTSLHPFNSDHVPFIDRSIPAVLTIEGTDDANHNIHTADDTLTISTTT